MNDRRPTLRLEHDRPGGGVAAQVTERALIGRARECDVVLDGDGVSRRHASIARVGGEWVLTDLGSSNGSFVNGARIGRAVLAAGDRVRFGAVALRCAIEGEAAALVEEGGPQTILAARPGAPEAPAWSDGATLFGERDGMPSADPLRIARTLRAATDALLEVDDLDGILERVLGLALGELPAERGLIALYDAEREALTQRRVRTRAEASPGPLRFSSQIARTAIETRHSVLVTDATTDTRFESGRSIAQLEIRSALCAPLCHRGRVVGLVYLDTSSADRPFGTEDLEIVTLLASLSAVAVEKARLAGEVEEERRIRAHLERYHAPGVVERIVRAGRAGRGAGQAMSSEEREISILFLDLCGFTALAERLPAGEVTRVLNELFARLVEAVFAHDGTLDKFTGDGMMVFFGAPFDQHDHAERAVRTALSMQALLARFNSERPGEPPIEMRIGVNTGRAVVGDVGALQRRDYTAIGDAVNVASRLESKVALPGWIVVGPQTHARLGDACEREALPPVRLKGKSVEIVPYRVLRWTR